VYRGINRAGRRVAIPCAVFPDRTSLQPPSTAVRRRHPNLPSPPFVGRFFRGKRERPSPRETYLGMLPSLLFRSAQFPISSKADYTAGLRVTRICCTTTLPAIQPSTAMLNVMERGAVNRHFLRSDPISRPIPASVFRRSKPRTGRWVRLIREGWNGGWPPELHTTGSDESVSRIIHLCLGIYGPDSMYLTSQEVPYMQHGC
jgi:hypothetical protein